MVKEEERNGEVRRKHNGEKKKIEKMRRGLKMSRSEEPRGILAMT
jgi:hypothetical protein